MKNPANSQSQLTALGLSILVGPFLCSVYGTLLVILPVLGNVVGKRIILKKC